MNDLLSLTSTQLKRAADLKEKIEALHKELAAMTGSTTPSTPAPKMKFKMSAAAKAKISAAAKAKLSALAKARWANVKGAK
jgi:hypothetical protein